MTVGLGIRLKSMSVRSWRWTSLRLPRNPCIAARVLLKSELHYILQIFAKILFMIALASNPKKMKFENPDPET